MKLEKAIEELGRGMRQNRSTNNQRLREAMKLGIEALEEKLEREKRGTP